MKRKNRKIVGAAALIAALAAGGVAFTAGQTLPTDTAGYGHISVTGGFDVSDISNSLNALGTDITSVQVTFQDAIPQTDTVKAGFDDETALDTCSTVDPDFKIYTCPVTHGTDTGDYENTEGASGYAVAVYH